MPLLSVEQQRHRRACKNKQPRQRCNNRRAPEPGLSGLNRGPLDTQRSNGAMFSNQSQLVRCGPVDRASNALRDPSLAKQYDHLPAGANGPAEQIGDAANDFGKRKQEPVQPCSHERQDAGTPLLRISVCSLVPKQKPSLRNTQEDIRYLVHAPCNGAQQQ